jgi:hypothetical protein
MWLGSWWRAATCLAVVGGAVHAHAADSGFQAGVLAAVSVADGEPANDIPGFGAQLRYALSDRWSIAASLVHAEYDYETPANIAGVAQDPSLEPIDALATATSLSAWMERTFNPDGGDNTWFVGFGLGAATVDAPDVSGPTANGGQFDVHTEVSTEILLSGLAGVRRTLGTTWYVEFLVHATQHLADWQVEDRVSGASGSIDDYLSLGGHLAIGIRW